MTPVPVHVLVQVIQMMSEVHMSSAFTVTRITTNTCNSVAIENLVKILQFTLNFLQILLVMLYVAVYVKIMLYFYSATA